MKNPFKTSLTIELFLTESQQVQIDLTDINGKIISVNYNSNMKEGINTILVRPDLAAGVYNLRVYTRENVVNKQVIKIR